MDANLVRTAPRPWLAATSAALLVGAVLSTTLPGLLSVVLVAGLGAAGLLAAREAKAVPGRLPDVALDAFILAMYAASRDPGFAVWQLPRDWLEVFHMTPVGVVVMVLVYFGAALVLLTRGERLLSWRERLALLIVALLFNVLLSLGADNLMRQLGHAVTLWLPVGEGVPLVVGRTVVLFGVMEVLTGTLRLLVAGRLTRNRRFHLLLLLSAFHAALSPHLADLPQIATGLGPVQGVLAIAAAALAQSGLWAVVYVITGLTIDALNGTPPTYHAAYSQWHSGATKGAIYGGVFMAIIVVAATILRIPGFVGFVEAMPYIPATIGGAVLFPLVQTLIASADGTPPFYGRLRGAYRDRRAFVRGAVIGLGTAIALTSGLRDESGLARFVGMFVLGALAYAGVDLAFDIAHKIEGRRTVLERWRVYALAALLGGLVGGALGWYFDAEQMVVVGNKFWAYADLDYHASGRQIGGFSTYPLFNKYGTMDLGTVSGGVRLFYTESLSGVVNWAIAAPLFSVNFFVLAALFKRSLAPLKQLVSATGFKDLVEQAVRVLRWGLWMAPVINSFLRQSADPSWYNQDGAIRTVAATLTDAFVPDESFRAWSLAIFTGLLAYDWVRVIIWFDHMGLRVATLVNLTFIGGDRADEAAARFTGHAGRTRAIPEGIRRFATWAPLLIPFYIPRGAAWDQAWTGAERIRNTAPPVAPAIWSLVGFYIVAAALAGLAVWAVARRWNGPRASAAPVAPGTPLCLLHGPQSFGLSNGCMTLQLGADGRGHLSVSGVIRHSHGIDITPRPNGPMQLRGPFVYMRDEARDETWSVAYQPMRHAGDDYVVKQTDPAQIKLRNTVSRIRSEAWITLDDAEPIEIYRLRLQNFDDKPRRLEITSFRELSVHELGAYLRDPAFNSMHVETWFVRGLNGVLARNRLLRDPATHRMSREICFHAVNPGPGGTLLGYEDSRTRFLGSGGLRDPAGIGSVRRPLDDEGSLYTFDPAAVLTLVVELPPSGEADIVFVTGRAPDEQAAARMIARHAGLPLVEPVALQTAMGRRRIIDPAPLPPPETWPFAFPDDRQLTLTPATPRPWAHVLANPLGYGAVVSNEGEIHSFNGNARQNALTPFRFESVPASMPGQVIYVVDLETGAVDTAGYVPFRHPDARYDVNYRLGAATFTCRRGDIEIELTVFVFTEAPADVRILKITNHGRRAKRFRVVPYFEMALAESPADSLGSLTATRDEGTEALLFNNPQNDFQQGWGFAVTSLMAATSETVRSRFLGSPGRDLTDPVMVETGQADGSREDDGRRCAAFAGTIEVPAGQSAEVTAVLGQTATRRDALVTASHLRDPAAARAGLKATEAWWAERLGAVSVETNNPAFDRLVNHWLPYQVLASRLWGRTGPQQRGGAYGFRDQLQDVLPFLFFDPSLARRQIVIHSGVQFPEGDVFKWWHVDTDGRTALGQRTRASDPHLWLPYVVTRYIEATGDWSVLAEHQPYLEGVAVPRHAMDILIAPRLSKEGGDVYDHCRRAIAYTMAHMGAHGLPLLGTGDWNDGIDAAGPAGRGEGTWLACFFYDILVRFIPLARRREGEAAAAVYRAEADRIAKAIESVWTGDHYIFDFHDSGKPLDPHSIMTAAWPVLSGAVGLERGIAALEHGLEALEKPNRVLLVTPPFDENSDPYPGRIADYPPGVRENGGQYSHGSSWTVDAYVRIAAVARANGDAALARRAIARAYEIWTKISPLGKTEGEELAIYGLAPHQQPADIYDGESYGGRGGWSWYTGSAARMLSAAYAIIGLRMENGQIRVPDDLFAPKGGLVVRRIRVKGETWENASETEELAEAV